MKIIICYTSLLSLFYVFLSIRTLLKRRKLKISVGDNGNSEMLRAMRVHANFAEYVPLALFLIYLTLQQGASDFVIHLLMLILFIGRISHAYGVSQTKENFIFRVSGMAMTFTVLISSSGFLLLSAFKDS
jgi:uncharacterized membrane protein YecN with MAPEG domain